MELCRGTACSLTVRIRELGIDFGCLPCGDNNAITDVAGVKVGHLSLVEGEEIRTGVTAVIAGDDFFSRRYSGALYTIHGNGQLTGGDWLNTSGLLESPIMLTNTLSVGDVYRGVVSYIVEQYPEEPVILPVIGECYDGFLNNLSLLAVKPEHAIQAIRSATTGMVTEGTVGAGTGMQAYGYKGGIGTSSRVVEDYTVGVLVNSNGGKREELSLQGRKVVGGLPTPKMTRDGSFVFVVATDAPLASLQLGQLAKRVTHGLARTGTISACGSGEFVVAFSTTSYRDKLAGYLVTTKLDKLFQAVSDASEEAIWNSMVTAQTMSGYQGHTLNNVCEVIPELFSSLNNRSNGD